MSGGEGIDLNEPLTVHRKARCFQCFDILERDRVVLLRAPPFSGKSSFATMIEHFAKERGYDSVYSTSLLEFHDSNFLDYWNKEFPPFLDLFQKVSLEKRLIIIDETQKLYKSPNSQFWEVLKHHMNPSSNRNKNLHVLLFAAYGESLSSNPQHQNYAGAPIAFANALSLAFLYFDQLEFEELIGKFNKTKYGNTSPISEIVSDYIYNMTEGHVGLVRCTLDNIGSRFYSHSTSISACDDKVITAYLLSGEYYGKILDTRAVPRRNHSNYQITEAETSVLTDILNSPRDRVSPYPDAGKNLATELLIKNGMLNTDSDGLIGFPSPILRSIQMNRLFSGGQGETISSFDLFLKKSLSLMRPSVFQNSLSKSSNDKLYERQFQVEFYRCAMRALGKSRGYCSPDVGRIFGTKGFLDFYVDSNLKWGVELVRDSDKLNEHAARFGLTGKYSNIPMNAHAILNFTFKEKHREAKRLPLPKVDQEWLIFYDRESTTFTVRAGRKKFYISMLGDEKTLA